MRKRILNYLQDKYFDYYLQHNLDYARITNKMEGLMIETHEEVRRINFSLIELNNKILNVKHYVEAERRYRDTIESLQNELLNSKK